MCLIIECCGVLLCSSTYVSCLWSLYITMQSKLLPRTFTSWSVNYPSLPLSFPTRPISKSHSPSLNAFELHKTRGSTDFEAVEIWKVWSEACKLPLLYFKKIYFMQSCLPAHSSSCCYFSAFSILFKNLFFPMIPFCYILLVK